MKVRVDPDLCAGCGPCADICPEVFELKDDQAVAKVEEVPKDLEAAVREAAETCPPGAIVIEED